MKTSLILLFLMLLAACSASPTGGGPSSTPALPATPTASPPPSATGQPSAASPLPAEYVWPARIPLSTAQPGAPVVLVRFAMLDEHTGWAIDTIGRRLRSVDGGRSWKNVTATAFGLLSVKDSLRAWDIAYIQISCRQLGCPDEWTRGFVVWRTLDGGQTWQQGTPFPSGVREFFPLKMQFVDDRTGWYLGRNGFPFTSLFQSLDSGGSWKLIHHFSDGCYSSSMIFLDGREGWVGNDCSRSAGAAGGTPLAEFLKGAARPALSHTLDGGLTWETVLLPAPALFPPELASPEAAQNLRFYCGVLQMQSISPESFLLRWDCAQNYPEATRHISYTYLTPDGGRSWNSWLSGGSENFIDSATGWRLFTPGNDRPNLLQHTGDGGLSWTDIKELGWQSAQIDFVSAQLGWALASDGLNTALVRSADGGRTWLEIKPVYAP
ncbi:MAG TPA: hypothetical protein VGK00_03055 [Anaerolineales bacterium]|jgi:photosystem II stability/assembly factor-like uncharacterized protein